MEQKKSVRNKKQKLDTERKRERKKVRKNKTKRTSINTLIFGAIPNRWLSNIWRLFVLDYSPSHSR